MKVERFLLVASALVAGGLGVAYLVRPELLAGWVGIVLPLPSARADFRAMYGGAQLGMAAFWIACAVRAAWVRPGLASVALILGGFGLARLGSILVDRPAGSLMIATCAVELTSTAIVTRVLLRARPALADN